MMKQAEIQEVAKHTITYLESCITSGMTVSHVVKLAESYMKDQGIEGFWYYGIGAFVFAGKETILSISGKAYTSTNTVIKEDDVITIDLSPECRGIWGDYARTIIIENGIVKKAIAQIENEEFREGLSTEEALHKKLIELATPEMTFHEVYDLMNGYLVQWGYENLDFAGNLGHSIEQVKSDRIYIEKGNHTRLSDKKYFTFEPHIRRKGSQYGFKMEDIYYFEGLKLKAL